MKIAVAGFHHETNTFAKKKTYYKDFKQADSWPKILKGKERKLFETSKIKLDILKSEKILGLN